MFVLQCVSTLVQFGGFLATHLSPDEYSSRVPSLDRLGLEFNVPSDVAFFMLRPIIQNSISVSGHYLELPFLTTEMWMCMPVGS